MNLPEKPIGEDGFEDFHSFEVHVTVAVSIDGSDYDPSDWDHDEEAFRKEMTKQAIQGMRNANLDIGDAWLDHIEEVTP